MSDSKKNSQEKFDAEFDAFLREENSRLAELYRKLPHPEPDAALDARVRAHARRALLDHDEGATESQPSLKSRTRARRWLPMFGVAATLVLAAGLAWRLAPQKVANRETASVAVVADAVPSQNSTPTGVPVPASAPSQPLEESAQQLPAASDEPAPSSAYRHKPDQATTRTQETTTTPTASERKSDGEPTVGRAVAPKIAAPALAAPAEKTTATPAPMPPQPAEPSTPALLKEESTQYAPAPAAVPPAPPAATSPRDAMENRAGAAQAFSTAAAPNGPRIAVERDLSDPTRYHWSNLGDATTSTPASGGIYPPDPPPLQTWIQIIRSMLRDGHRDAAKRALIDLRARHPDYNVPADLRDLK